MGKDYKILSVSRSADKNEIKKAYRQIALKYHPDKNKDPGAEDKFKEVPEVYEVRTDSKLSELDSPVPVSSPHRFSSPLPSPCSFIIIPQMYRPFIGYLSYIRILMGKGLLQRQTNVLLNRCLNCLLLA